MKIELSHSPKGRQFVIGDVHGCFLTLSALIQQINLQQEDQLIFLGDVINKGNDSRKVLDYLMQLELEYELYCIKGNHEHNLLTAYSCGMDFFEDFLHAYHADDLMDGDLYAYLDFCAKMAYYIETPTHIFSHLGFSPSIPYPISDTRAYFHNQNIEISTTAIQSKKQVHGHLTVALKTIQEAVNGEQTIINIDGGCCYKKIEGLGHLCALEITHNTLYVQKNLEKEIRPIAQPIDLIL
ncbi:metallophosphoesterase family protein [Aureispira anguillae]|uniref:Serine/threonine protein phosphatase n=1 Tax=Aureispira anguillae TaxID=2864201 RepID=A0A915YGD3_9BACT|nr:metallophosphoesterase family protein [Aureispira anguillae]BDS12662.1 serine/threonine protein phosphatase [Aureispira anguillae]